MTEPISTLLHREADALDVPPPAAAQVLRRARSRRRRSRVASTVATLAVVGVVATTAALATGPDGGRGVDPAGHTGRDADTGVTFAVGTTLWYDDATRSVEIADLAVKSIYPTSAGILVRHGDNGNSVDGGEQRFTLVTPDGELRPLDLVTEGVAHTTDPGQPYVAWGQRDAAGEVEVVVYDVRSDQEVTRLPVPGLGGDHVSVQLTGDRAFVSTVGEGYGHAVLDWRAGEVLPSTLDVTDVGGDLGVSNRSVVDLDSGSAVFRPRERGAFLDLSPDGRYALVSTHRPAGTTTTVVDLGARTAGRELAGLAPYSWTAGGVPYTVGADWITTCDPGTGRCTGTRPDLGVSEQELQDTLRLIGATYES